MPTTAVKIPGVKTPATASQSSEAAAAIDFDRSMLEGTNVNSDTLLATDFLNHFNEVSMLIEMIPAMPECMEDIEGWKAITYQEHFAVSGLRDADVAIAAYEHVQPDIREHFDETIGRLNERIALAKAEVRELLTIDDIAHREVKAHHIGHEINQLIDEASGIVNGTALPPQAEESEAESAAQSAIDALFD